VEGDHLHIAVQAPTNGEPISVFLHITDNLIDFFRGPGYQRRRRRGEERPDLHLARKCAFLPSFAILDKQHFIGFQNVISRILKADAPANSAKSSNYIKSQIAYSIYDGRYKANEPRTSVAPPVQLFHPAFGHFLDDMKSNHALPDDIVRQTAEYMRAATAIYESEEKR
jgi:hypothetical protein